MACCWSTIAIASLALLLFVGLLGVNDLLPAKDCCHQIIETISVNLLRTHAHNHTTHTTKTSKLFHMMDSFNAEKKKGEKESRIMGKKYAILTLAILQQFTKLLLFIQMLFYSPLQIA